MAVPKAQMEIVFEALFLLFMQISWNCIFGFYIGPPVVFQTQICIQKSIWIILTSRSTKQVEKNKRYAFFFVT
jgi:hypothetical protein